MSLAKKGGRDSPGRRSDPGKGPEAWRDQWAGARGRVHAKVGKAWKSRLEHLDWTFMARAVLYKS